MFTLKGTLPHLVNNNQIFNWIKGGEWSIGRISINTVHLWKTQCCDGYSVLYLGIESADLYISRLFAFYGLNCLLVK